jgi:hypothetical protein
LEPGEERTQLAKLLYTRSYSLAYLSMDMDLNMTYGLPAAAADGTQFCGAAAGQNGGGGNGRFLKQEILLIFILKFHGFCSFHLFIKFACFRRFMFYIIIYSILIFSRTSRNFRLVHGRRRSAQHGGGIGGGRLLL